MIVAIKAMAPIPTMKLRLQIRARTKEIPSIITDWEMKARLDTLTPACWSRPSKPLRLTVVWAGRTTEVSLPLIQIRSVRSRPEAPLPSPNHWPEKVSTRIQRHDRKPKTAIGTTSGCWGIISIRFMIHPRSGLQTAGSSVRSPTG